MGDGGLWRRQDPKKRVKAGSLKAQLAIMATSMIGEGNPYGQVHVTLQFQAFEPPAAAGRPPIPVAIEFCTHSKGEFSPEMQLELSSLGSMLLMREVAEGPVVRAAFLPGGKVGKSKGKRSGHPMILRLDLPEGGDSLGEDKYIVSFASSQELAEWKAMLTASCTMDPLAATMKQQANAVERANASRIFKLGGPQLEAAASSDEEN
jgi:hypothetical protein